MRAGRTVFSQIMDFMPRRDFSRCVTRYRGNYKVQKFTCHEQFRCMAFAQLTYRHSLRDIEVCLRAMGSRLYRMGIRSRISKSTLADANENRDCRIYEDFAQLLMARAKTMYADEDFGIELDASLYALDSTIIDLCLTSFPWSRLNQYRGGVKLHTLLNLRGNIPEFIRISGGTVSDYYGMDSLVLEPGAFYVLDRGYYSYARLFLINKAPAFFVIRAVSKFNGQLIERHPIDRGAGILADQTVTFKTKQQRDKYPEPMRQVKYYDQVTGKKLVFLTNSFDLPAKTVADIYKARWQIELFFKWIKQHLRIKNFFGTSENAVKTQIWIAVATYVLVAILKKQYQLEHSLYKILQVLSVTLFEKVPVDQLLRDLDDYTEEGPFSNQLKLL
jgi:transposase